MTDSNAPVICWFFNDLRLSDHAALAAAAELGLVLPIYIRDRAAAGTWQEGGASRWWLHHSLDDLARRIREQGGRLVLADGAAEEILESVVEATGAQAIFFSRAYEPWAAEQQRRVHALLGERLSVKRFPGRLLLEPEQVRTNDGRPYKVFTPFWRASLAQIGDRAAREMPDQLDWYQGDNVASDDLAAWALLPTKPDWAGGLRESWQPGEAGAHERLRDFVTHAADDYAEGRDRPGKDHTSRLSPHLHFGEISPNQVWQALKMAAGFGEVSGQASDAYLRELGWRDFSYHLLTLFPELPEANFRDQFDRFPWRSDNTELERWQRGQTGYPLVDAGMRQLWHTGWMHNRVRMVVGSFLVKHLRQHWRAGEDWFWDTLVDADLASNAASWQWVAGSGADAAPYFRIFNPMSQGEKFDPDGAYVRRWVPELAKVPQKFLNRPWEAPVEILRQAGVELGKDYPNPIVDHRTAREAALAAFQESKG
ncbi:MAG: deoxyribodipyrimidine photo-lyase [Pseudomonadota bacterium]